MVLFCLIHKINFLRVADCLLPGVILAQAMGRWGNFFNQEVYGGLVTDPSMQWFPFAVYIEREGASGTMRSSSTRCSPTSSSSRCCSP